MFSSDANILAMMLIWHLQRYKIYMHICFVTVISDPGYHDQSPGWQIHNSYLNARFPPNISYLTFLFIIWRHLCKISWSVLFMWFLWLWEFQWRSKITENWNDIFSHAHKHGNLEIPEISWKIRVFVPLYKSENIRKF